MVRKPARKAVRSSATAKAAAPAGAGSEHEKIIAAFMALLAEKPIERIGFAEIAKEARVSLGQLRGEFASTLAILAAHIKATDRAVLAADLSDMAEEPPRERLFDVLMRRFEVLAPHREAVR
jgi:AcrR family transcriptional regulator